MRVLVTWGSKRGGTEAIARMIGETLRNEGFDVEMLSADRVEDVSRFEAVIVGGALYANRWHRAARRFVKRNQTHLRTVPVWFFSSGPLDDSADRLTIPPTAEVQGLMDRIGARAHVTFGGRLLPDAKGLMARAMARTHAGDWRTPARVRAWAQGVAGALPTARPGKVAAVRGRSLFRLVMHGVLGWALCTATMGILLDTTSLSAAIAVHAVAAPLFFLGISLHYFRARGARAALPTALAFTGIVAALDLVVVAWLVMGSLEMFASFAGTWLPFTLIFTATWLTGSLMNVLPSPKPRPA